MVARSTATYPCRRVPTRGLIGTLARWHKPSRAAPGTLAGRSKFDKYLISEFEEAQADLRWGHPITDEAVTHWSQLMYEAYPAVTAVTGEDEHLELCYMVDVAKFADQQTRASRQAEPLFPRAGEHLCVLIYAAIGTTRTGAAW